MSDTPPMGARTRRLLLRLLRPEDRAEFIRMREVSAAHLAPWSPLPPEGQTPEAAFEADLRRAGETLAAGTGCRLCAFLLGTDPPRLVGRFNLNNIVRGVFQNADVGWALAADAVGQGLGTEGVGAVLDLAFAAGEEGGLGLHRLQANIIPANARSLALAARCGFRREGFGKSMLKIAGRWEDHIMLAKLAEEHEATGAVLGAAAMG